MGGRSAQAPAGNGVGGAPTHAGGKPVVTGPGTGGNLAAMFGGGGGNLAGQFLGNQGYQGGSGVNVPLITQPTREGLPQLPPVKPPAPPTQPTQRMPTPQEISFRASQLAPNVPAYSQNGGVNAMDYNSGAMGSKAERAGQALRIIQMMEQAGKMPAGSFDKAMANAPNQFRNLVSPVTSLPQQPAAPYQPSNAARLAQAMNDRFR